MIIVLKLDRYTTLVSIAIKTGVFKMSNQTVLNELNETLAQLNNELNDLDQQLTNATQQRDLFEYSCSDDEFNEHLDNCYDEVEVCGYSYSASQALYELDPTAWRCAKNDYESEYDLDDCEEYQEILETLEELENQISDKESVIDGIEQDIAAIENLIDATEPDEDL